MSLIIIIMLNYELIYYKIYKTKDIIVHYYIFNIQSIFIFI